jgi:hypothetical protein
VRITRRTALKYGAGAGAVLILPWRPGARRALAAPGGSPTLPAAGIPKYRMPLVVPPAMPRSRRLVATGGRNVDYYEIAVRQFSQRVLPPPLPETTVWSYGSAGHPATFNYPAFTIEARWRTPVRVRWINDLRHGDGNFLPHLLPVDPTLHWANPAGGSAGRDGRPVFESTPGPYTGPVPIVTHLHGGEHTPQESDGFPEAWFLPDARDIPPGFARTGTYYDVFKARPPSAQAGHRARLSSSTRTTSGRRRSGTTTTRSA